jgi:hypothetical protein
MILSIVVDERASEDEAKREMFYGYRRRASSGELA